MCNLGKLQTLPEILRGFHDFSGSPVISNGGTPKENMSEFLGYHLKPVVQNGGFYLGESGHFFGKD